MSSLVYQYHYTKGLGPGFHGSHEKGRVPDPPLQSPLDLKLNYTSSPKPSGIATSTRCVLPEAMAPSRAGPSSATVETRVAPKP